MSHSRNGVPSLVGHRKFPPQEPPRGRTLQRESWHWWRSVATPSARSTGTCRTPTSKSGFGSLVRPIHLFFDCFLYFPCLVSKMTNVRVILRQAKDVTNSSSNDHVRICWLIFGQVCGFPSPLHSTTSRDSGHLRTFSIGSQESGAHA